VGSQVDLYSGDHLMPLLLTMAVAGADSVGDGDAHAAQTLTAVEVER
jgi:hypothetical protein